MRVYLFPFQTVSDAQLGLELQRVCRRRFLVGLEMKKASEIEANGYLSDAEPERFTQRSWALRLRDVILGAALAVLLGKAFLLVDPLSNFYGRYLEVKNVDGSISEPNLTKYEPGEKWKDDIRPIFPVRPWDISTNFPYPRKLEYEVTEGTWLRLDVHPESGEVVFDILGPLTQSYCTHESSQVYVSFY